MRTLSVRSAHFPLVQAPRPRSIGARNSSAKRATVGFQNRGSIACAGVRASRQLTGIHPGDAAASFGVGAKSRSQCLPMLFVMTDAPPTQLPALAAAGVCSGQRPAPGSQQASPVRASRAGCPARARTRGLRPGSRRLLPKYRLRRNTCSGKGVVNSSDSPWLPTVVSVGQTTELIARNRGVRRLMKSCRDSSSRAPPRAF